MNRPCTGCGRIITIPDIPLPEGYTQKCTACGLSNRISDDYGSEPKLSPSPPENVWEGSGGFDSTFDSTADSLNNTHVKVEAPIGTAEEKLLWKFEQKLRDMETRLRREMADDPLDSTLPQGKRMVSSTAKPAELLIGSHNAQLYKNCEALLKTKGYTIQIATRLEMALSMIQQKPYEVLLLDQAFLSSGEAGRKIFKYIKLTELSVRRCQTVVLITPGIATGEPQVFYQWGIDFNIHPRDLDRLDECLNQVIQLKSELMDAYLA